MAQIWSIYKLKQMDFIYKIFYLIAIIIKMIMKFLAKIFGVAINAFDDVFSEVKCPECGKTNMNHDKFCIHCGILLPLQTQSQRYSQSKQSQSIQTKKICSNCKYENEINTKFCIKCGKSAFTTEITYKKDELSATYSSIEGNLP